MLDDLAPPRSDRAGAASLSRRGSGSRGSHLVCDPSGAVPHPDLGDEWRYIPENLDLRNEILGIDYDAATAAFAAQVTTPNPPPGGEFWFENTWAAYRRATIFQRDESERPKPYEIYRAEVEGADA